MSRGVFGEERRRLKDDGHEFVAWVPKGEALIVDHQRGGGLLIQVGVTRQGQREWNAVQLPKGLADQLRKHIGARKP